jgi:hypothetical protein
VKVKLFKTVFFIFISLTSLASIHPLSKNSAFVKTDPLHILISKTNHIYHYENTMLADGSNFNLTNLRALKIIIEDFLHRSNDAGHSSIILLKVLNEASINEDSRKTIDLIKQKEYKRAAPTKIEKKLIELTEQQ